MNLLIIYQSIEGQTRKIADFVESQLRAAGHVVALFNTEDKLGAVSFEGVDRVILAAPVHERRHSKSFEVFVSASRGDLMARPTLLLSVSLKAAFPEGLEEAQDYLTEMKMRTGFEPTRQMLVAGAVRASSYSYYESQIVQNVALEGRRVRLTDGVREFTDWEALGAAVTGFGRAAL